ncbi:MAG: hypothetical protein JRH17_15200, partial [Deltaproteobacteria bacterium]|nr:hypothetical protein [Deltaproteobacteria bacterium]
MRVPEVAGKTLHELDLTRRTGCVISRIDQSGSLVIPGGETILECGDHLMVTGRVDELQAFGQLIGSEISTDLLRSRELPTRRIQVRHKAVARHSRADLRILNRYHCVVTRVERGSLWIEPDAGVVLVRNDILEVVGERLGPLRTHVPREARQLVRDLGILLFVGETGLAAGSAL